MVFTSQNRVARREISATRYQIAKVWTLRWVPWRSPEWKREVHERDRGTFTRHVHATSGTALKAFFSTRGGDFLWWFAIGSALPSMFIVFCFLIQIKRKNPVNGIILSMAYFLSQIEFIIVYSVCCCMMIFIIQWGEKLFKVSAVFGAAFLERALSIACKSHQCGIFYTGSFTNKSMPKRRKICATTVSKLNNGQNFVTGL